MNTWFLTLNILAAEASPEAGNIGMTVVALTALTGLAVNLLVLKRGGKREVSITDKPLRVELEREFVPRREFDQLRSDIRNFETKVDQVMERVFDKMDSRDRQLTEKIEAVAKGAYEGRHRLHERVNDNRERIATVENAVKTCPRPANCEPDHKR